MAKNNSKFGGLFSIVTYTGFQETIYFCINIGMPINVLSDAHEHLNEILVAMKIIVV